MSKESVGYECAQHSVHPTGGSLRVFKQFAWLEAGSGKVAFSRPVHPRVTQTVGRYRKKKMIEAISEENKSSFAEDFLKQLSMVGKILIKPIPSTFRSILDYPNIRITAAIILLVLARLGVDTVELVKGNQFFDQWTIAIPVYLLLLAYTTGSMCKDFFRGEKHLFKQFFLALVGIYCASLFVNGVLTGLAQQLILIYQVVLTVMAVHAIANLNIWKSTFAVIIGGVVASLGFIFIGPIIDLLFFFI